jgi:hypothetical protein
MPPDAANKNDLSMVDGTAASPRLVQGALATQNLLFADDAPMALVKTFRDGGPADQDELAQPSS